MSKNNSYILALSDEIEIATPYLVAGKYVGTGSQGQQKLQETPPHMFTAVQLKK